MFSKIIKGLFWISFLVALVAGGYLFMMSGTDSYFCRSARWIKNMAPVIPIPSGFCGVTEPIEPESIPPVLLKAADMDRVFRQDPVYDKFKKQQTINISSGCIFDPLAPEIDSETHIIWINLDDKPHAIVAEEPEDENIMNFSFSSPLIVPGGQYKLFINQVGSYVYYCSDRPESKGEFTVVH